MSNTKITINMSNTKITSYDCLSPIVAYNKRSSKSVYDWIDRNIIDYKLFNNIIRDNKPSTQEFIKIYNNLSNNEELPENVFKHFIKVINTFKNTYWGVGPFIKSGGIWDIRDDIRSLPIKQQSIIFDASTQTE